MTSKFTRQALLLSGTLLVPAAATAQYAGTPAAAVSTISNPTAATTDAIEVGAGDQSSGSFRFGKYTGLTDNGALGVSNVLIRERDAWDSSSTRFWEVLGTNLGLTSRAISGGVGNQGLWSASAF